MTAQRYVATNRFRVKQGREAAFEKRWAERPSRLGSLDGFRFFTMMRRVETKVRRTEAAHVSTDRHVATHGAPLLVPSVFQNSEFVLISEHFR